MLCNWPRHVLTLFSKHATELATLFYNRANNFYHVKLLGITIEKHFSLIKRIENLCQNVNYKLYALRRIRKYLIVVQAKLLGNAFIDSPFNYVTLIWITVWKVSIFGVFLVRIFPHLDWIRRDALYLSDNKNFEYWHFSCSGCSARRRLNLRMERYILRPSEYSPVKCFLSWFARMQWQYLYSQTKFAVFIDGNLQKYCNH